MIAEAFGLDAPDTEGRAKADRAMAERIAAMDLPVDRQERRAALDAILKPLIDRAVAACAEARQASLQSDANNEKFAKAQMEGGYWLAPLKAVADYWAVEAARLQIVAHEAAQTAHGAGRAIEFAKRGEAWRPSNTEDDMNALIVAETALAPLGRSALFRECTTEARRLEKSDSCCAALRDPDLQEVEGDGSWRRDTGRLSSGGAPPGRASGRGGDRFSGFGL